MNKESEIYRLKAENEKLKALLRAQEKDAQLGKAFPRIAHDLINIMSLTQRSARVALRSVEKLETNLYLLGDWIEESTFEEVLFDIDTREELLPKITDRLGSVVERFGFLMRMISDLQTYTRISNYKVRVESINLYDLLFQVVQDTTELFADEDISIGINIIGNQDFIVNSDEQKLSRIFLNLIKNALEIVLAKSRAIPQEQEYSPQIDIIFSRVKGKTEIAVTDNGWGIPEEYYENVFQPFVSYKTIGNHSGLGLTIVSELVNLLGGVVVVESKKDISCTFTLLLPDLPTS